MSTSPSSASESGFELRTHFVRGRNALVARGDFGEIYVDYYLHLADHGLRVEPAHDALFKRALAAFGLHCVARPWGDLTAWTINFQQPLVNLFLTGDNQDGSLAGRIFTENVKELPENLFYAEVAGGSQPRRRSTVAFTGADPMLAVEAFYRQSEQQPARYFQLGEEEFALVVAHPDCDLAWFEALTTEQVRSLEQTETVVLLERRLYRWHCGCNQRRMLEVLTPTFQADAESLFAGCETLEMRCPRCSARYVITREALEAFVASKP